MKREFCVVFDIDDTLYLESSYVHSGFEAVGRWAAQWLRVEDFADRCWKRFANGARGAIFNDVLKETNCASNPEVIAALIETYRTHIPAIALADDAAECLSILVSQFPIAVISDGPISSQSRKADVLGLSRFATPLILTGFLGSSFSKPAALAFQQIEKAHPEKLYAYIADNPHKDFTAPKQLGWTTIRIRRPGGMHSRVENLDAIPDYELADCSDLISILHSV